jgi:Protein of unknown function (DUF1236)
MRNVQNRIATAIAAALLLTTAPLVSAQTQNPQRESPVFASKLNLSMEQRHIIMEFIKGRNVASEPSNVKVTVGQVIPKTVQLQAMPADVGQKVSQVRNYSYFLKNNQVVLVDPKDNKIAEVIEMR